MLSLLLAMTAVVETPLIVTLPKRARPAAAQVRRQAARKAPARRVRNANMCVTGSCTPASPSRYRLSGVAEPRFNGKLDVVAKDTRMACGVIGAPVCPSRGTQLVATPVD